MDNTQSSANIAHIENIDNTEMPLVTVLTTPFPQTTEGPHATILRKIKERERDIQKYKRQIQELDFAIAIQESYNLNIAQGELIPRSSSAPPVDLDSLEAAEHANKIIQQEEQVHSLLQSITEKKRDYAQKQQITSPAPRITVETPGPHRLQPRPERPEDITYRQQQQQQQQAEQAKQATTQPQSRSSEAYIVNVFKSLTKVLSDNNKQLHSNDVSDPPKFYGQDSH
jgi:hypothetical protein